MRKLISASKRKWVLGGILGFAAIALTTTGFATWIVGINATTTNGDVGVTVDTVSNNGVELKLVLGEDSDIELKEANLATGPVVTVTGNDTVKNPLQISVNTFTLEVGKQFLDANEITGVEFKLKYVTDDSTKDIKNNADNNHANVDQSKHHWESSSAYRSAGCAGSWSSLYRCQPACAMKNLKRSVFLWTSTKMRRKRRKKPVNVQEDPKTGGRRQKQTHQKIGKCLGK